MAPVIITPDSNTSMMSARSTCAACSSRVYPSPPSVSVAAAGIDPSIDAGSHLRNRQPEAMSWLLPYNRNYFLCNYQTYPQTGVVWVIGLLIPPFCEGNKRGSHDKKSSTLGDKSPSIRDIIRIVGWVGWKEKLECTCRVGEIGLMSNTELE